MSWLGSIIFNYFDTTYRKTFLDISHNSERQLINIQHILRPKFHEPLRLKKRSKVGFGSDGERSSEDGEQPSVDNSPNSTRFMYRIAGTTTTIYKYAVVSARDNITQGWRTYERADFTMYTRV